MSIVTLINGKPMSESRMKRGKAFFSISAVSKMFSVHQQTLRLYEKEGLICPKRSDGNTRMFSEEDVAKLEEIIHLTHQLGINLAGVEMILQLQKKMKKMQADMNKMFTNTQNELSLETNNRKILIKEFSQQLNIKKQNNYDLNKEKQAADTTNPSFKEWDIDYTE